MERYVGRGALCAFCFSSVALYLPSSACAVVLSEVLYDATGSDAGKSFVELYGTPGTNLSGWSLRGVNGGDGAVYASTYGVFPGLVQGVDLSQEDAVPAE